MYRPAHVWSCGVSRIGPDLLVESVGHRAIEGHVLPTLKRSTPYMLASVGAQSKYFFKRPVAEKQIESIVYLCTTLTAVEMQDKSGRADGPTLTYKGQQAKKMCFKHGQQLTAKNCD